MDTNAVQRHRDTILNCLRDGDISIRRRALELSYALTNEQNVRILTRELLAFLEIADNEFKLGMTTQISLAAERFAPNKRWHIDTVLRTLKLVSASSQSHMYVAVESVIGWELRSRRGLGCIHPTSCTYTRASGVYCFKALSCARVRYLTRIIDAGCDVGHRRVQRRAD